jgi:hypothetical protein
MTSAASDVDHVSELLGLVESSARGSAVRLESLRLLAAVPASHLPVSRTVSALVSVLAQSDVDAELVATLTVLVNLSAESTFEAALEAHADALVLTLVPLVSQRLSVAARADVRRLGSTLLANLSTVEAHTDALCGPDDVTASAAANTPIRLRRLLNLCTAMPNDASLEHIALALQNCSRRASVRAMLLADDAAPLAALANTVAQGTPVRRRGVAHVLRNMFVDELSRKRLLTASRTIAPLLAAAKTEQDASALSALVDVAYMLALVEAAHATLRSLNAADELRAIFDDRQAELDPTTAERMSFVIRELTKPKFIIAPNAYEAGAAESTNAVPQGPAAPLAPALPSVVRPSNDMDVLD